MYISKSDKIPLVYKTTTKWITAAFKGFTFNSNIYKGIDEIIDEIYWCWKNKQYETPKYIIENNGNIEINDKLLIINE